MKTHHLLLAAAVAAISLSGPTAASAAPGVSDQDRAFVAKVSQGGMYEVALGKLAEARGSSQDIKDQGNTEAHDHELVGQALKSAADGAGIAFPSELNADFAAKLAKAGALSGVAFDRHYVEDMKTIHAADGAAFLKESKDGANPGLKAFAASTFDIVQRHIGELDAKTTEIK